MTDPHSIRPGLILGTAAWFGVFGVFLIACRIPVVLPGSPITSYMVAFAALCFVVMASAYGTSGRWADRDGLSLLGVGVVLVFGLVLTEVGDAVYALGAGYGLLLICLAVGALVGRRIEDAAYLWPLTLVMVCFDLWSVLSAAGLTQELVVAPEAEATRALLVLSFPVPGIGVEPILGIGDVIVVSLLYSAVHWLGLSIRRLTFGIAVGFALCLAALVTLEIPLPALAFIAPAGVLALGVEVKPRLRELGGAALFCVVGLTVLQLIRG